LSYSNNIENTYSCSVFEMAKKTLEESFEKFS